jgi:hypothetical protein
MCPLVVHVALVPGLGPPSYLGAVAPLIASDLRLAHRPAQRKDEDPGEPAVQHHGGIPGVGVGEPGQLVQMRLVIDVEPVLLDRRVELHRLEEVVRAGAGKDRDAVCRGAEVLPNPRLDSLYVTVVALPVGAVGLVGAAPGRQLAAKKPVHVVMPMLIGLGVEVEAQHRKGGRRKGDQAIEVFLEQGGHGVFSVVSCQSRVASHESRVPSHGSYVSASAGPPP